MSRTLNRLIRMVDAPTFVGLKKSQTYELIAKGEFPRPIPLTDGGKAVAFLESELIEWQAKRIAARDQQAAKPAPVEAAPVDNPAPIKAPPFKRIAARDRKPDTPVEASDAQRK